MDKDASAVRNQKVFVRLASVTALQARFNELIDQSKNATSNISKESARYRALGMANAIRTLELDGVIAIPQGF